MQLFQPMDTTTDHRDPSLATILADCTRNPASLSTVDWAAVNPAFLPSSIPPQSPFHFPNHNYAATESTHPQLPTSQAPTHSTPQKTRLPPRVSPHRANHLSSADARPFRVLSTPALSTRVGHLNPHSPDTSTRSTFAHKSARHLFSSPRWACRFAKHAGLST